MQPLDSRLTSPELEALMRAERSRLHGETWMAATLGSAALAIVLVTVMVEPESRLLHLAWLGVLAVVLAIRVAVGLAHRRAAPASASSQQWISRFRMVLLAHGCTWGLASILMFDNLDPVHQTFLVFAVTGICVSSLTAYAFDLRASLLFCLPSLIPLGVSLWQTDNEVNRVTSLAVLVFMAYVTVVSVRSSRTVRQNVALRGMEGRRLEALERSHRQLDQAERMAQLGSFDWDAASGSLLWTDEHYRIWGLDPQLVPASHELFISGVHPEDRELVETRLQLVHLGERAYDLTYRVVTPDGSVRHVHGRSEVIRGPANEVLRLVGTVQDVSERLRAEAAIADQQHVLSAMQETTQLGFWFGDRQGITTDLNPAMCKLLGRRAADVRGRRAEEFFDAPNAAALREHFVSPRGVRQGTLDLTLQRPDGSSVHCLVTVTPINNVLGQQVGVVGMFSDLTLIDSTRDALSTAEFVVNSVNDMVSLLDQEARYLLVNDAWCRRLGLVREQVIGQHSEKVVPGLSSDDRKAAFADALKLGERRTLRASVDLPGLGPRFLETDLTPLCSTDAGIAGVVSVTRDITEHEATRSALAESLENLRRIFNATTDGMFAYDPDDASGRLLFVNDRFLEMWNLPVGEAIPPTRADVVTASRRMFVDREAEDARLRDILVLEVPHEDRVTTVDGRLLLRHSVPLRDGQRRTRVWIFRDITRQERAFEALRSSEGEQRALMDAFPGYVAVIDEKFIYRHVNQRVADLVGRDPAAMIGQSMRDLLGESQFAEIAAEIDIARQVGRAVSTRSYPATPLRPRVDLQVTHVMGLHGAASERWCYAFGVDITDRVQAQDALVLAKEDAESANRAKSAFLASVSHELKTPLNAILGFAQLLRNDPQVTASAGDKAGEIERAGSHLLSLVDDLIDLGRVESGSLDLSLSRVAIDAAINEGLSLIAPLAAQQGIRLMYSGGDARHAMVIADATRLRQVIINLLSNAIKYNRADGSVRVTCERRQGAGDGVSGRPRIRVSVRDTGAGIAQDKLTSIFMAFDRLGAERGPIEGTGIGLVISRRLVQAMGGELGFDTEVGKGSLFWFELNQSVALTPVAALPSPPSPRVALRRPQVLVAEDYAPNQAVLRLQLTGLGCDVDVVNDGIAALARWSEGSYDLLLTDLDMPLMDGLELARTIRLRERTRGGHLSIVILSAAVVADERQRCLGSGADDLLAKPISASGLSAMLARWVNLPVPPQAASAGAGRSLAGAEGAVLDLARLYDVLGWTSPSRARTLLLTFLDAARIGLKELEKPRVAAIGVVREMHRQRSSAETVGAMRYAAMAGALEQQTRTGLPSSLRERLVGLARELDAVEAAVEQIASGAESGPAPLPFDAEPITHGSVLVVDDDPVVLLQMDQMLHGIGVQEVLSARNGVEAVDLVARRKGSVDVVVCDLNMPEMDGVEMIRRLSQGDFTGALILMSGADEQILTTVGELANLQGLKVLGQIHKPVTPAAMRSLLRQTSAAPAGRSAVRTDPASTPEAIREAMARGEFLVWLQPKVDARTLEPQGVEALARWRRADGSFVPPDLFIVLAERNGLIGELSRLLVAQALAEGARLHRAGHRLKISINLSALWLDDLNLPDLLARSVDEVGLRPADIMLEVTETGVTKDVTIALDVLSRIRLKGFGLSIDDFGIGYSSFEQVGRIPFTEMKIDRSFVNRGVRDAAARAILESSMAMAQKLHLSTVAEGVETAAELEMIRELGCDSVQGYLVARPMPVAALLDWLASRSPP